MTYLAGFGIATGVGAKAFIPILVLGGLHYTHYFELSERFLWIADPVVMIVLGALTLIEIVVDAHPELGEYSDTVAYLPKLAAGFIGFAAVVGSVDDSLTHLAASGLLGSTTAAGAQWLRNQVRRPFRFEVEHLHEGVGKLVSVSEAGVSATMAGTAVLAPPLSVLLMAGMGGAALVVARAVDARRVACIHCDGPMRPGAVVCIHCGRDQVKADPAGG